MPDLKIDERKVLFERSDARIVGRGMPGWNVQLIFETASEDALGNKAWTSIGRISSSRSKQFCSDEMATTEALDMALRILAEILLENQS